ncbi:hypothetical protein [Streptomyces gilvosporeus]|uniref:hypothetical protein n=1 Tax=Streptomyces gilvosporeus TaxID=553510 RepID=UPI00131C08D3|nr:hypothetical protein [Streptomyces gilvosporeus]
MAPRLSVRPDGHLMGCHDCFTGRVREVHAAVRATTAPYVSHVLRRARAAALTDAVLAAGPQPTLDEGELTR